MNKLQLQELCKKLGIKGYSNKNKEQLMNLLKNNEVLTKENKNTSVKYINERIEKEICYNIIEQLQDSNMMDEYNICKSVQNKIKKLDDILNKYIDEKTKKLIIKEYFNDLIPAGTKGVCRGNKFNRIIQDKILSINLDKKRFLIEFEKICPYYKTSEKPDWYIYDLLSKKTIIGMNQLDLWSGGQQINRGNKYILEKNNDDVNKLLCVVCNKTIVKNCNTSLFKIFEKGFQNDTLCYINNLSNIIKNYFKLED